MTRRFWCWLGAAMVAASCSLNPQPDLPGGESSTAAGARSFGGYTGVDVPSGHGGATTSDSGGTPPVPPNGHPDGDAGSPGESEGPPPPPHGAEAGEGGAAGAPSVQDGGAVATSSRAAGGAGAGG